MVHERRFCVEVSLTMCVCVLTYYLLFINIRGKNLCRIPIENIV